DFYPKEFADKYRQDDIRIYKNDSSEEFEEEYVKDGKELWVHTVKVPIRSEDGISDGILGIFWDITARRQAAKFLTESKDILEVKVQERTSELSIANKHLHYKITELEKTKAELERAYKNLKETESQLFQADKLASIGQLAAGVAHEINNPIGFISSNTNVLRDYINTYKKQIEMSRDLQNAIEVGNNDEIRMLLESIRQFDEEENLQFIMKDSDTLIEESKEGLDRVEKIVMDLCSFSRDDKGGIEVVDINENIKIILGVLNNEIMLKCDLVEEFGDIPRIKCNSQKIKQVIMNLVMNAVQSLNEWGTVIIKTSKIDGFVLIEVEDNGCGVPKEELIKIFDPFYTTKEVGKGTGLGLSISYEIIKRHRGEILVESEVGKGTKFIVKLPIDSNEE
ncbi:MAG: PAS domain-containing protein, partial [Candidatus Omnitrophica bacterium]|nr:PAS domain-containing protein [Candidatus Omnitrophota bacterium]